jgi:Acetyltransferase (GNAT) domain
MGETLQPLSKLPQRLLFEYWDREGRPPELIQWKYLSGRSSPQSERGYAWVRNGKVAGFLGLIPFHLKLNGQRVSAAWTCDWSLANHNSGGGMGVLLIRRALQEYGILCQLGGNQSTHYILSRLAATAVEDAGMIFHLPLRVGAVLRLFRRRIPSVPLDRSNFINNLRLPMVVDRAGNDLCIFESGVSSSLGHFVENSGDQAAITGYDFEYLRWQIGECPTLTSETCFLHGESACAAALIWRQKSSFDFWRMAIWTSTGAEKELDVLLSNVIRRVFELNGFLLSVLVSRLDTPIIEALRRRRFVAGPRRRPLYILSSTKSGEKIPELRGLSFLDTDLAHRF